MIPRNSEEFRKLLDLCKAAKADAWADSDKRYDRLDAVRFLFLWMIWNCLEDPKRSCASPESLARAKLDRDSKFPSPESEVSEILEKMVRSGVSPEEISKLINFKQQDVVIQFLYALEDPSYGQYEQFQDDLRFGLFEFDDAGTPIAGSGVTDLDHRFYDAVPERYESMVPIAYLDE